MTDTISNNNNNFEVDLSFQGKIVTTLSEITVSTTASELYQLAVQALLSIEEGGEEEGLSSGQLHIKLLYRGKNLQVGDDSIVFPTKPTTKNKKPKLIILKSSAAQVKELNSKRSDPLVRGFEQEKKPTKETKNKYWGDLLAYTSTEYKFCRLQACTWQSFGHRPSEKTPHDFAAHALLEKLATDPGIGAVLQERELLVGTLGEMDPIDDRLMQKKEQEGACLLGYNTNHGTRIDIKLRTDDLQAFRPYPELVSTLIHELSHNWVGDHNLLFWTNYAQMYAEYLYTHAWLRSTIVAGKTTAEIAGLDPALLGNVYDYIMKSLVPEMAQHRLHPSMIAQQIQSRCQELEAKATQGHQLGGGGDTGGAGGGSARERALAAAERRAREQKDRKDKR